MKDRESQIHEYITKTKYMIGLVDYNESVYEMPNSLDEYKIHEDLRKSLRSFMDLLYTELGFIKHKKFMEK